mgnify:CR=1 FL=1
MIQTLLISILIVCLIPDKKRVQLWNFVATRVAFLGDPISTSLDITGDVNFIGDDFLEFTEEFKSMKMHIQKLESPKIDVNEIAELTAKKVELLFDETTIIKHLELKGWKVTRL